MLSCFLTYHVSNSFKLDIYVDLIVICCTPPIVFFIVLIISVFRSCVGVTSSSHSALVSFPVVWLHNFFLAFASSFVVFIKLFYRSHHCNGPASRGSSQPSPVRSLKFNLMAEICSRFCARQAVEVSSHRFTGPAAEVRSHRRTYRSIR